MNRPGAKPGSGPSGSRHPATKTKKFCTRGEEFFDFQKGLGYTPPKHQSPEHFEYLFQDDTSASLVKKLFTLKSSQRLSCEEIDRFEELQKQGSVLYGMDLEEAVARRHKINEMHGQKRLQRVTRKDELNKELKTREERLARTKQLISALEKQKEQDWQTKQAKVSQITGIVKKFIRENEKEIEISTKLLNEKQQQVEMSVMLIKKDLSTSKSKNNESTHICQIDGRGVLEQEEKLFEAIQEMMDKHGTNLIMKEAGYDLEGDLLSSENMKKLFSQFEKDFYRLKHCIIYEKVEEVNSEQKLAGLQTATDNFERYCQRANQISGFSEETRNKLSKDINDSIRSSDMALEKEESPLEDQAREITAVALNRQFSDLSNIGARYKKRVQEFFSLVLNILKAQKLRISVIKNFVKAEAQLYGRLVSNIDENLSVISKQSQELSSTKPIQYSDLTVEGQALHYLIGSLGIRNPFEILVSVPRTLTFAKKAASELDKQYWSVLLEKQKQFELHRKQVQKRVQVMLQMYRGGDDDRNTTRISEAEDYTKSLELKLKEVQQTRAGLSKKNQERRNEIYEKLKKLVEDTE